MTTFKENLKKICEMRNTKLTPMLMDLGFSSSKTTAINKGQLPTEDQLIRMADYLHCSVMDFFADNEEELKELKETDSTSSDDERDILEIYRSLDRRQKHEFMAMVYSLGKN